MPDLKLGTDPKDQTKIGHKMPVTLMPFCDGKAVNKTFVDISQISPMMSSHQDVATIAAEVSAAAATLGSREFC